MGFTTFLPHKHIRGYLHSNGAAFPQTSDAFAYLCELEEKHRVALGECDYVIAALWGSDARFADMYGYSDIGTWPGNPTRSNWVLKEGVWSQPTAPTVKGSESGCEDTDLLLGAEGILRRTCGSLDEFLRSENSLKIPVYRG
jgi:hypothetical protein